MTPGDVKVSFVIPVRNDAARLARCLHSIAQNTYRRSAVEIIVADNGSTDSSREVAAAAGAKVLTLPGLRVSELRNRAAAAATGDVLAFVDADHEIVRNWVESAVDVLGQDGVGAAGALCLPPEPGTWVQRTYGALRGRTIGQSDVPWLGAGNLAIRRAAFARVNGFDESLDTCEDVDLCQRIRTAGWRVVGDERLRNIHFGDPDTLTHLFRGERWRGMDNLRVSVRGGLTLRDLPGVAFPVLGAGAMILLVVGILAAPFLGSRVIPTIVVAASLLIILSTVRTIRMAVAASLRSPVNLAEAFAVALTYDVARAFALLNRAGHHRQP